MANILIYSDNANLAKQLITAAKSIDGNVAALSINNGQLAQELESCGTKVYSIENQDLVLADVGAVSEAIAQVVDTASTDTVFLGADRRGKELSGRLAQLINAGCLADVNWLALKDGQIVCSRNALGGATIADQVITSNKKVISISPKSFDVSSQNSGGSIESISVTVHPTINLQSTNQKETESVDITEAPILFAVGQGVDGQDQVADIEKVAHAINGEIACSKPVATDKKWLSEERIIGISGSLCKPDLAILFGISGQVQFAVGVRDAKTLVAINNEESSPICSMSDYYLIADINDVLPELEAALVK